MPQTRTWAAIRESICTRCIDGDTHGECHLDPVIECQLERQLPVIVDLVRTTRPEGMADYLRELRMITCAHCHYQSAEGRCGLPEDVACALDRYFPLVVDIIQHNLPPHDRRGPRIDHHQKA